MNATLLFLFLQRVSWVQSERPATHTGQRQTCRGPNIKIWFQCPHPPPTWYVVAIKNITQIQLTQLWFSLLLKFVSSPPHLISGSKGLTQGQLQSGLQGVEYWIFDTCLHTFRPHWGFVQTNFSSLGKNAAFVSMRPLCRRRRGANQCGHSEDVSTCFKWSHTCRTLCTTFCF